MLSQASNVGLRFVGDIERGKPSVQFDKLLSVLTSLGISLKLELPPEVVRRKLEKCPCWSTTF